MRYLIFLLTFIFIPISIFAHPTTTDTLYWSSPSAWPEGQVPTAGARVLIPSGTIIIMDVTPPPLLSIDILGELHIQDKKDLSVQTAKIYVHESALLAIGQSDNPFHHRFTIHFVDRLGSENGLAVEAGGRLSVHGKSINGEQEVWEGFQPPAPNQRYPGHTIRFEASGYAQVNVQDGATQLQMEGIDFENWGGITRNGFAVKIGALAVQREPSVKSVLVNKLASQKQSSAYIRNCNFIQIPSGVIQLDKTQQFTIENNRFHQISGPAVQCAPSGIGQGNRIHNNLAAYCWLDDKVRPLGVIHVFHPGQSIRNNKIFAVSGGNAFRFELPPAYESFDWTKVLTTFAFQDNLARGFQAISAQQQRSKTAALYFDLFEHHQLWPFKGNQFIDFPLGIHNLSKNILYDSTLIFNCASGLIPGSAAFYRTQIIFEKNHCIKVEPEVAILAEGLDQVNNAPIIHQLFVKGYPVHFLFRGPLAPHHDLSQLEFDREADIRFYNFPKEQQVRIRNTEFPYDNNKMAHNHSFHLPGVTEELASRDKDTNTDTNKRKTPDPQEHHHHHHGQQADVQWVVLPPASPFITKACQPLANRLSFVCPSAAFGRLTLSTGLGLDDPVHEHPRRFEEPNIRPTRQAWLSMSEQPKNRISMEVAANASYELKWANNQELTDISCEWDGVPGSHIELSFRYPFDRPLGLRSFGKRVPEVKNLKMLRQSEQTCYYINPTTQTAYLKIVNEGNHDELVLYSFSANTEITLNQEAVPMQIDFQSNTQQLSLAYQLPKKAPVKLELLDYFGNTRAVLVDKEERKGSHEVLIPLSSFPLDSTLFFYSLEVAGQRHKGPIYVADE